MKPRSMIASAAALLAAGALLSVPAVAKTALPADEGSKIVSVTKADQGMTQLAQAEKKAKGKKKGKAKKKKGKGKKKKS